MQDAVKDDFLKRLDCLEEELETLKSVGFNLVNEKLIDQFEENLQPRRKSTSPFKKDKSWSTLSGKQIKRKLGI